MRRDSETITSYVSPAVKAELQALAERNGRTVASEIRLAIKAWLAQHAEVTA